MTARLIPPQAKPHNSVVRVSSAWYVVALANELGKKPLAVTLLGAPLVVFRTKSGAPGALLDRCPHRNVPLSVGEVAGEHLRCAYHGWEFDRGGTCQVIPGLCGEVESERGKRATAYPAVEQDGWIWVWGAPETEPTAPPFRFPEVDTNRYTAVRRTVSARGTLHATLENALDVPHTAFLHGGLFRTAQRKNRIRAIIRRYSDRAIAEYCDEPRPSGLAGRILSPSGGIVIHFDRFFLPSIAQVEYSIGDENHFLVTSACTPVSDFETRLFALVQFRTRIPGLFLKPFLEPLARRIFAQDAKMLSMQSDTIQRFGGEQFESTEIDILGPHIYKLLKDAERGTVAPAEPTEAPSYEKEITFLA